MSDSFVIPWTVACQAPLSVGFPRQEYWSELPFPSPGDLPNPGFEPMSSALAGGFFTTEPPTRPPVKFSCYYYSSPNRKPSTLGFLNYSANTYRIPSGTWACK